MRVKVLFSLSHQLLFVALMACVPFNPWRAAAQEVTGAQRASAVTRSSSPKGVATLEEGLLCRPRQRRR